MSQKKAGFERLAGILREELECLKKLWKVEKAKQEYLIRGDFSEGFDDILEEEKKYIVQLEDLEKRRVSELELELGGEGVLGNFNDFWILKKEMKEQAEKIKKIEDTNRIMMEDRLKLVRYTLDLFRLDGGKRLGYGVGKSGGDGGAGGSEYHPYLLDTRI